MRLDADRGLVWRVGVALLIAGPVVAGLAGVVLPAFGYLPALGGLNFSLDGFARLAAVPGLGRSVLLSISAGIAAPLLALGIVAAFLAAFAGTPALSRWQHAISPLLSVPHAAAAFGLAFLIAPSGFLARLVSPWATGWQTPPDVAIVNDPMGLAMIAGLAAKEIPFLLLMALAALPQVPHDLSRRLASSLGYGRMAGFLHLVWPSVYRQIRLATFAVVAFSGSVVDVAAILGPNAPAPLAVRLVQWMNDPELEMRFMASAGALLQLAATGLACLVWLLLERLGAALLAMLRHGGRRYRHDRAARLVAGFAMATPAAALASGIVLLALWSIAGLWQFPDTLPDALTLRSWSHAGTRVIAPVSATIVIGLVSAGLSLLLATGVLQASAVAPGKRWQALIYLPLVVPQVSFLFGLQMLAASSGLPGGLALVTAAHVVFVLPYVWLSLSGPWRAFDRRYEMVAAGLGASRTRIFWRIRAPMMTRALLTAAAVGFAVSVGLYLPTLLIGAGRIDTITTEAVALASGGNRRVIGVYAVVQMALPVIGFAIATLAPALLLRGRKTLGI